jgi:endonuclease YncB( thermonuclease family)
MRFAVPAFGLLALVALPAHADVVGKATVVDANTLEIAGERLRLYGIDAPELDQSCRWPNKVIPCGRIATSAAKDLIAGVERVVCETHGRDASGRWIATCTADGFDIGRNMVHTGWALADRRQSTAYVEIEDQARKAGRGLWRGQFVPPWEWRNRGK